MKARVVPDADVARNNKDCHEPERRRKACLTRSVTHEAPQRHRDGDRVSCNADKKRKFWQRSPS